MPRIVDSTGYSDDLRCKLLEAYEGGARSLRKLANQFRASWGYTKKVRAHEMRTGSKERVAQQRHGPEILRENPPGHVVVHQINPDLLWQGNINVLDRVGELSIICGRVTS